MTTVRDLYVDIPGVTGIISVNLSESYKSFSRSCEIVCESTTLDIGDSISVDLGYTNNHGTVFTGIVKAISQKVPDQTIIISCFDELIKAVDYFMASEDPDNPFKRSSIDATDLVEDLLNEAGITSFSGTASSFIFTEPTFNLVSVADAINQISNIIAWHCWADENGTVHFGNRKPYVMSGDTSSYSFTTGNSGNILSISLIESDNDLRNKVVIYGNGVNSVAQSSSPYLPSGFYKTAVIASPLITTQSMADDSASYNLNLYNRLTREVTLDAIGNKNIHVNDVVSVSEPRTGVTGDWFVYAVTHTLSNDGYLMRMVLRS